MEWKWTLKTSTAYNAGSFHAENSNTSLYICLKLLDQTLQTQYHKLHNTV